MRNPATRIGRFRTPFVRVLIVAVLLPAVLFPGILGAGGSRSRSDRYSRISYRKELSCGFRSDGRVHFLLEYTVSRARRPIWFIMPIERSPVYYFHKIFLYRYDPDTGSLDRLATVRDEVGFQTSVRDTRFVEEEPGRFVFAYRAGWESGKGLLHDLLIWDESTGRLYTVDGEAATPDASIRPHYPDDSPEIQRYFADYISPWWDNPGVISITDLRREVLAEVTREDWDLPRDW